MLGHYLTDKLFGFRANRNRRGLHYINAECAVHGLHTCRRITLMLDNETVTSLFLLKKIIFSRVDNSRVSYSISLPHTSLF